MITENFVDAYNANLANLLFEEVGEDNYQSQYQSHLEQVTKSFDGLLGSQRILFENHNVTVVEAVAVGLHKVGGETQLVVAQPTLESRMYSKRTERLIRRIGLYAVGDDSLNLARRYNLELQLNEGGTIQEVGSASIDSSSRKAIPSSVGRLHHFSQLLDEVISKKNEKQAQLH